MTRLAPGDARKTTAAAIGLSQVNRTGVGDRQSVLLAKRHSLFCGISIQVRRHDLGAV